MNPELSLDVQTVAANARAWRDFAGTPLYAVLKGKGYGWGLALLARALENEADAFCVSDADELAELRRWSAKRAIILGAVPPDRLAGVLHANALPSIGTAIEVEVCANIFAQMNAPAAMRVCIRPAVAWSGLSLEELRALRPALKRAGAQVHLWTHVSDFERRGEQLRDFREGLRVLREAEIDVADGDFASTFPLAADGPSGGAVRVGVGLFGATGGFAVPGVRCALRVGAPVVRTERHSARTRVGYGGTMLRMEERVATARCGYADGLPKTLEGVDDILSVGMQYVTARASRLSAGDSQLVLLDGASNLDDFASRCGRLPHEIVTAFGNSARANGVSLEV